MLRAAICRSVNVRTFPCCERRITVYERSHDDWIEVRQRFCGTCSATLQRELSISNGRIDGATGSRDGAMNKSVA